MFRSLPGILSSSRLVPTVIVFTPNGGSIQTIDIPEGVSSVTIKAWGAGGAAGDWVDANNKGAGGGYAKGNLKISGPVTLDIYVGEGGKAPPAGSPNNGPGGWPGGADGGNSSIGNGGGGGGFSAVFPNGDFTTPYIVAGAGGGGGTNNGFPGGGLENWDTPHSLEGQLGSQTAGGVGGTTNANQLVAGSDGAFLAGGEGASIAFALAGGGGGSGYYGGGGGSASDGSGNGFGGGGGSSYIGHDDLTSRQTLFNGTGYNTRDLAANTDDPDYADEAGIGGPSNDVDGNGGRVVVRYYTKLPQVLQAWDISFAVYSVPGTTFDISAQTEDITGVTFNDDGTRVYITGSGSFPTVRDVFQYDLLTAWDLTTAIGGSPISSFFVGNEDNNPRDVAFSADGTRMFVQGGQFTVQYDLSVAWDITSASAGSPVGKIDVTPEVGTAVGVAFKTDGTRMYVISSTPESIFQYDLSTAWDVTTAVYGSPGVSLDVTAQVPFPRGVQFKSDGTRMYTVGAGSDAVFQYELSVAWDLSTASYGSPGITFDVSTEDDNPHGVAFGNNGTKMYIAGSRNEKIVEYNLSSAWDISTAVFGSPGVSIDVSTVTSFPAGVTFKPDGTKMYTVGPGLNRIFQYTVSTAWDLSTATYDTVFFDVGSEDTAPSGVSFSSDGTRMFMSGINTASVYQYDLSSAWDLSTAAAGSPVVSLSITEDSSPSGLTFDSNGTKLYVVGTSTNSVYQYDLSSAWDLSTAVAGSPVVSFDVSGQQTFPLDVAFRINGTRMFISGSGSSAVHQYDLSSAWDLSTVSGGSPIVSFDVSEDGFPTGISFKTDGTRMYIIGNGTDHIYQYDL